jgi:predicted nuclease of predicted toxin-antitoxin system
VKLLLDSCLSHRLADELRASGHDVIAAAEWPKDPGDPQVLTIAHVQHRVLVTLDTDFGELAIVKGQQHFGIIRIDGPRAHEYARAVQEALMNMPTISMPAASSSAKLDACVFIDRPDAHRMRPHASPLPAPPSRTPPSPRRRAE